MCAAQVVDGGSIGRDLQNPYRKVFLEPFSDWLQAGKIVDGTP
jgi:hypothetical protein